MSRTPARIALALALAASAGAAQAQTAAQTVAPVPARQDPAAIAQQMRDAEHDHAAELAAQQQALAQARAAAAEEDRLSAARVAAAAKLREAETATAAAAGRMAALAARRQEAASRLQAQSDALRPLLPLIERLSLYPAETLLAVPAEPAAAMRGVMVLQGVARQLEQDAAALRREQAEVANLAAAMAAEEPALAAAQSAQAAQAAELDRQIAAARAARRAGEDAAAAADQRAARDAASAESLRVMIVQIDAARHQAALRAQADAARAERQKRLQAAADDRKRAEALASPGGPGLPDPQGQLTAPVGGTLVRMWGDSTDAGPATGLSYQAPPGARVVSPCQGRIVFAGPFRSYGLLLIVDCGGGYHFVLAGLDRLDVGVGGTVRAGEPVGAMPAWDPRVPGSRPLLYVELRHDGQAVDPAPWLRAKG